MIIVMKMTATEKDVEKVSKMVTDKGLNVSVVNGTGQSVIGIIGDTTQIDPKAIEVDEAVDHVMRVSEPYKLANRAFHPDDTIVDVAGVKVGGDNLALIAGPCSVESEEQVIEIAKAAKAAGANILRGGAFKPRTSPYAFQGMGSSGLDILVAAKEATGLPICSELMDAQYLEEFNEKVDLIQIGARNMQNFDLLKKVGAGTKKPILLKRGLSATFEEWIMSAEYIMANGNPNVILCERGVRTFETYTRNTLDLQAIPVVKKLTHLPIIIDPSHAGGKWWLVEPMAKAAVAAGADGLMIEVHNNPEKALCDGPQSLRPERYEELLKQRVLAKDLCFDLDHIKPSSYEKRLEVITSLLGYQPINIELISPFMCDYGNKIKIGKNAFINSNCYFMDGGGIELGDNVYIGPSCGLYTAIHPTEYKIRNTGLEQALPIKIGNNVWLGGNVVILPGVTIGDGCVIGAGSVVTKDIVPNSVACGNPCKVIRSIEN